MTTYSIRQLHLTTRREVMNEFGAAPHALSDELVARLQNFPYIFKISVATGEWPAALRAGLMQSGLVVHFATANRAYLFAEAGSIENWQRHQTFDTDEEKSFAAALDNFLQRRRRENFTIAAAHSQEITLAGRTLMMGVLNCTPDSFFDGGRHFSYDAAIAHGVRLAEHGADIIDVGGESTRPRGVYGEGAAPITAEEEKQRVLPVIAALAKQIQIPLSIDTYKAPVAEAAVAAGASIVNDISGFQFDAAMPATVARLGAAVVIMHTQGTPANMQANPVYENLLEELYFYFERQIELARRAGIAENQIIIDPGLGFGKRIEDNYEIIRRLRELRGLGCPLLVGPSRKAFVGKPLNLPPEERLEGTAAAVTAAIMNGAHLIRVHDVKEMRRVAALADLLAGQET